MLTVFSQTIESSTGVGNSNQSSSSQGTSQPASQEQSSTPNTSDDVYLVDPPLLNYTDPIVRHDGGKHSSVIVNYDPEYPEDADDTKMTYNEEYDQAKVYGKLIPVVKVNNIVIPSEKINYLKLSYVDFVPTLRLEIIDDNQKIKSQDMPTRDNVITVILVPQVEGAYKKVSIDFYTETIPERYDDVITYTDCKYKMPELYCGLPNTYTHRGCSSCGTQAEPRPNTFELFHEIAMKLGLGYQTTEEVQNIEDRMPRHTQNFPLIEFLQNQLAMGGLGNSSIFDAWIDLYGYITVVNLPWLMSQNIDERYLGIKAVNGIMNSNEIMPDPQYILVNRTINNFNTNSSKTNLTFISYEHLIDYSELMKNGALKNFYMFNRAGDPTANSDVGGNNIDQINIQAGVSSYSENNRADWQTQAPTIMLTEVNDYPTAIQKEIRKAYLINLRTKRLKVFMDDYNLGLQRGTFINFAAFTDNPQHKQKLMNEGSALEKPREDNIIEDNKIDNIDSHDVMLNDAVSILDMSVSGIYYIDGMEFEYDSKFQQIKQILYLIPKGTTNQLINSDSVPAMEENDDDISPAPPTSEAKSESSQPYSDTDNPLRTSFGIIK